jgi:hypothetical protein
MSQQSTIRSSIKMRVRNRSCFSVPSFELSTEIISNDDHTTTAQSTEVQLKPIGNHHDISPPISPSMKSQQTSSYTNQYTIDEEESSSPRGFTRNRSAGLFQRRGRFLVWPATHKSNEICSDVSSIPSIDA